MVAYSLTILRKLAFSLILVILLFFYYCFLVDLFSDSLVFFFQLFFLVFFFLFNIVNFLIFTNVENFFLVYLDFFVNFISHDYWFHFLRVLLVFFIDLLFFLYYFFLHFFDLNNFLGLFFHFGHTINELFYEAVVSFVEQTEDNTIFHDTWRPRYLFGSTLEQTTRIRNVVNIFNFSDVFYEKIFIYRRVGILNSRFWLFTAYTQERAMFEEFNFDDTLQNNEVGRLVEPSRWLLDFRDFRVSDYLDPWHFFSNEDVLRRSRLPRKEYVSVQLVHNYYSIMESNNPVPTHRVYYDYFSSTFFFYELVLIFLFYYNFLFVVFDAHLQSDLLGAKSEEDEEIEEGSFDDMEHPYQMNTYLPEDLDAKLDTLYPDEMFDYLDDDDFSWDAVLAQPATPRFHVPVNLSDFERIKEFNSLFDEFRTFSFLYPIYRLLYRISSYRFIDIFLFTDSGRCFKIIFYLILYLPIGFIIVSVKCFICVFDFMILLPGFLKFIIFALLVSYGVIYF